jgi:hypothetical protein
MKKLLLIILAFSIHVTANAASEFSTIEERMTGKEFKETGLGKLADQELASLNEWLRRHSVATLENASARSSAGAASTASASSIEDTRGLKENKNKDDDDLGRLINSTIVGTFDGWDRKGTLFKLANGMIWQQAENDTFFINAVEDPEVTIKKGFVGTWRLSLVGYNSTVRVKRFQ